MGENRSGTITHHALLEPEDNLARGRSDRQSHGANHTTHSGSGHLVYNGDLPGSPVSYTCTSYPGVAYGHLGDGLHLGYQAAIVSMHSPTYGHFWLSVVDHPGRTISSTLAEALVQAAETRMGMRLMRRTELLSDRIGTLEVENRHIQAQVAASQGELNDIQAQRLEIEVQITRHQETLAQSETQYQDKTI